MPGKEEHPLEEIKENEDFDETIARWILEESGDGKSEEEIAELTKLLREELDPTLQDAIDE